MIIQVPIARPRIPSLPCFGAISFLSSWAFRRAASLFERKSLLIRPEPNMKPKMTETMFPVKKVAHQTGETLSQPIFKMALTRPQMPQKQNRIPNQPWYGSTLDNNSFALGFFESNSEGTAIILNKINEIPQIIIVAFLGRTNFNTCYRSFSPIDVGTVNLMVQRCPRTDPCKTLTTAKLPSLKMGRLLPNPLPRVGTPSCP